MRAYISKLSLAFMLIFLQYSGIGYASEFVAPTTEQVFQIVTCDIGYESEVCECDNRLYSIVVDCVRGANIATNNIFKNFEQEQYVSNDDYSVEDNINRFWYNSFLRVFNDKWKMQLECQVAKEELDLEEYARIAVAVRHYARIFVRIHANDSNSLEKIQARDLEKYGNQSGPTFDWLLDHQLQKQEQTATKKGLIFNFDLHRAYRSIINSSTKTNTKVNAFMKCYDYFSSRVCNWVGSNLAKYAD